MGSLYDEALVVLHGLWRRRWLALGVGWGVALLGWLVVSLIPNAYESQARIFVKPQALLTDKMGITAGERMSGVETVRQTLTSVQTLEQVVRGTDLAQHVASDADVTAKALGLQKAITIVAQQDNLFQITARVADPALSDGQNAKLAHAVVAKLIDLFIDGNLHNGRVETGQSLQFVDAQLETRAKALAEAEAKRAAFEAKYLSALPGSGPVADRIGQARGELARVTSDLSAAQSGLSAINAQLGATPATTQSAGVATGGVSAAAGRMAAIEGQIADGQSRGWTDQHPDMVALRGQLARARAQGGGGSVRMSPGTSSPNPMYVALRSQQAERQATVGALAARKAQIEGQINGVLAQQASNPEFSEQMTALDRDYQAIKAQYDKLLADREDLKLRGQVQTQTDAVKFNVIDPPSMSSVPATPNRPLLLTLILLAAVAAGIGAAFAQTQLQASYPTAAKLERASGLRVIGTITEVVNATERAARARRTKQFAGGAAALVGIYAVLMIVEFVQRGMVA